MKLSALLLLLPFGLGAQHYYGDDLFDDGLPLPNLSELRWTTYDPNTFYAKKEARLNGVQTMKHYVKEKSGEKLVGTYTYNAKGRVLSMVNPRRSAVYTYQDDTLVTSITTTYKNGSKSILTNEFANGKKTHALYLFDGKKTSETKLTYSDNLLTSESYERWYKNNSFLTVNRFENKKKVYSEEFRNGKKLHQHRYVYNEAGKSTLREHTDFRKKKPRVYLMEHTYNEEGKLIRSVYTIDGEVERTWDYSCNDKGTMEVTKVEEVSSVCTFREERNDGSYSVFTRTIRDGKPYLVEQRYDADSTLLGIKEFLNDTVMIFESQTDAVSEKNDHYTKKGRYWYGREYRFDAEKRIIGTKSFGRRKKARHHVEVKYNDKGLVDQLHTRYRGNKSRTSRYEYAFAP